MRTIHNTSGVTVLAHATAHLPILSVSFGESRRSNLISQRQKTTQYSGSIGLGKQRGLVFPRKETRLAENLEVV
jgi:hypothetical protein